MAITPATLEKLQHFALAPAASRATTFTGATVNVIDLNDYEGDIQIILDAGAAADTGTMTGKIQHSLNGTTDFDDVTGGGFTAVAQTASKQVLTLNSDSLRRHIRFVGTIAASGTTVYSVNGYGMKKYEG